MLYGENPFPFRELRIACFDLFVNEKFVIMVQNSTCV